MSKVGEIIQAVDAGDSLTAEQLLPLVYDELRKLASAHLAGEIAGNSLQPTALVHEAYLRLIGGGNPEHWNSRGHFFGAAAVAIRRTLVDRARGKRSLKRGGAFVRQGLDENPPTSPEPQENILALDAALERLALVHAQAASLVELRYFSGLTISQAALALEISPRTAGRLWTYARAWLRREIDGAGG